MVPSGCSLFAYAFSQQAGHASAKGIVFVIQQLFLHIPWASLGVDSGYVPYTAYSAKQSFLKEHPDLAQGFTNALQKGMEKYVSCIRDSRKYPRPSELM